PQRAPRGTRARVVAPLDVTGPGAAFPHQPAWRQELTVSHLLLTDDEVARALRTRDLTDPAEGPHALQRLVDDIGAALTRAWNSVRRVHRGPRIVSVHDNYDALGYDTDAVTRDARYTRYVTPTEVLRSHTSALIPGALRTLDSSPNDLVLLCPGIVYRRD